MVWYSCVVIVKRTFLTRFNKQTNSFGWFFKNKLGLSCSKNVNTITVHNCHSYISWMEFVFDVRDCTTLYAAASWTVETASSLATLTHPRWLSLCDTELVYQLLVLTCCHMWAVRYILIVDATVDYIPLEMDWDWAGPDRKGEREGVEYPTLALCWNID